MTDPKKTTANQGGKKAKKLRLNKETVKDLSIAERQTGKVVGGVVVATQTQKGFQACQ